MQSVVLALGIINWIQVGLGSARHYIIINKSAHLVLGIILLLTSQSHDQQVGLVSTRHYTNMSVRLAPGIILTFSLVNARHYTNRLVWLVPGIILTSRSS